jgi:hypothetical protein
MSRYLVTQTQEITVEAPSAAVARTIAAAGFQQKLSPKNIQAGMSISNIQNVKLHVEKVS